jgi:hypothetical protein
MDVSGGPSGFSAGPSSVVLVTDVNTGKSFPLSDTFHATAGTAHSVTVGATNYTAFFSPGTTGSVSITDAVTGDMLDDSELTAVHPDGAGSFSGEFNVSFVNPAILAEFGLGPKWSPTGSVGITFHESAVSGADITGVIGGGSTTVLTVATPVPEANTFMLFFFGIGMLISAYHVRAHSRQ